MAAFNFLLHGVLPSNLSSMKIKRKCERFFAEEGKLFRRSSTAPLGCLATEEVAIVLKEVHAGVWGRKCKRCSSFLTARNLIDTCPPSPSTLSEPPLPFSLDRARQKP